MRKLSMDELNRKSVEEFKESEKLPVIVVLENIRSAYNVGSVFRTADAFLLEAIYITGYTCTPPHKEIKKTALGAEDYLNWLRVQNLQTAVAVLKRKGYTIVALEQTADAQNISIAKLDGKIALIVGNEVNGLDDQSLQNAEHKIFIPMKGRKESFNVAVAGALALHILGSKD